MKKILMALFLSVVPVAYGQVLTVEGKRELDSYLQEAIQDTTIPGMVALVVNSDGIIYEEAFGLRDVRNNEPMTTDSLFRLASMTKPVTSLAVMMLEEEGLVSLDDAIEDYLPELGDREVFTSFDVETGEYSASPATEKITIRHLLTHTSGLGYSFDSQELAILMGTDFAASVLQYPLLHEPGSAWTYGESTRVLGALVEAVSGQELFAFMQEKILDPLQMQDTFYDVPVSKNSRLVTVHRTVAGSLVEDANPAQTSSPHNGDGGLTGTAEDYSRFIRLFLNGGEFEESGRLLSSEGIANMGRNHSGVKVRLMDSTNPAVGLPFPLGADVDSFGLGFQVTESAEVNLRARGSMAWAGIYNTEFWIDPETGIGAILMMQYLPFYDEAAIEVLVGFEQRIYQSLE